MSVNRLSCLSEGVRRFVAPRRRAVAPPMRVCGLGLPKFPADARTPSAASLFARARSPPWQGAFGAAGTVQAACTAKRPDLISRVFESRSVDLTRDRQWAPLRSEPNLKDDSTQPSDRASMAHARAHKRVQSRFYLGGRSSPSIQPAIAGNSIGSRSLHFGQRNARGPLPSIGFTITLSASQCSHLTVADGKTWPMAHCAAVCRSPSIPFCVNGKE
jgi:hypothetical protein